MALQHHFRVSKRQKRKTRGPEVQRKKLSTIPRLPDVQKECQPQPFHDTALGKLTSKLRVQIYQCLLVAPQTQADGELQKGYHAMKNAPPTGSLLSTPLRFTHLKESSLTVLRTCRQIHLEAHPILYGSGLPYFANAGELSRFLVSVGPSVCIQLKALRIGTLVSRRSSKEQDFQNQHEISPLYSGFCTSSCTGPIDVCSTKAWNLLKKCTNLQMVYIDMSGGEENMHFDFLRTHVNQQHYYLRLLGPHRWFVQQRKPLPSNDAARDLVPGIYYKLDSSGDRMRRDVLVEVAMIPAPPSQPFLETGLGKLPPELRAQIYHELVAGPSMHAGQELAARGIHNEKTTPHAPYTTSTSFVYLQASCLTILRTCRQIYVEACPVFYARTAYYIANRRDFDRLDPPPFSILPPPLHKDIVTSLCLKDLILHVNSETNLSFAFFGLITTELEDWGSLRKIYLCMRVGQEIQYIGFLFYLPHMALSVIEFLDDSHWIIRLQRPDDEWRVQYACFYGTNYRRGKGDVKLSFDELNSQRQKLRIESRASGLEEGQERVVEVEIDAPMEKLMPLEMRQMMDKFGSLSVR